MGNSPVDTDIHGVPAITRRYIVVPMAFLVCICLTGCFSPQARYERRLANATKYGRFGGERVCIQESERVLPVRATWVSTLYNLDFGKHTSKSSFQKEAQGLFARLAQYRVNTVFFQVRSWNDAFYPSKINPWSRWLTGQEGRSFANFDPLSFVISEARKHQISFHAWLNPYRVCVIPTAQRKEEALAKLSPLNFARRHPECVQVAPLNSKLKQLFLDPGHPAVQKHIFATVDELLKNYDLDGIHLDDYFYPYSPITNQDDATYAKYNPKKLPLEQWRRENVNMMIHGISVRVRKAAEQQKRVIQFGVSPFGIWANKSHHSMGSKTAGLESFYTIYCDTRKWICEGWIDYVAPQLYWSFDSPISAFAGLVEWWSTQVAGTNVKLYIGLALHLQATKWKGLPEIQNQIKYIKNDPNVTGASLFRSSFVTQDLW